MLNKVKQLVKELWANDNVRRVLHTFWQTFLAVLVAQLAVVDGWNTLWTVLVAATAAGLSAVKNELARRWGARS